MPLRNAAHPINDLFVQNVSPSHTHHATGCTIPLQALPAQRVFPVKDGLITVYYFLETDDLEKLKSTVNNWYKAGKTVAVLPSKAPGASHSLLIETIHYGFGSSHSNFSQELDFVLGLGI